MRLKWIIPVLSLLVAALLSSCQEASEPQILPTLADLNQIATENAATAVADIIPTAARRDTLPPTWTPEPTESPILEEAAPSPTPESLPLINGRIYYLINNDAIVVLDPNTTYEELLSIPQLGQHISDLSISPDGHWLAYVAPGSGSAREVFITNTTGTEAYQVSQLGFSEVSQPTWSPNGNAIAFIAAQAPGSPQGIYVINTSTQGQTQVTQQTGNNITSLAWNETGERLYFNNEIIQAVDVSTGVVSVELTAATGFGPDYSLSHSPTENYLYYLKTNRNFSTGITSGTLTGLIFSGYAEAPTELKSNLEQLDTLRYSQDGRNLLMSNSHSVFVQDNQLLSIETLYSDSRIPPQPAISPDSEWVAFTDLDAQNIAQIFLIPNGEGAIRQLTFHQEGVISNLVWGTN